jgi:hypothetical protein
MAISGNLRTMPFPDLMQWISMSRKTGTLVIKGERFTKKILFHDGTVAAVTSNNPREHLGYFLVGWGYLTEDELHHLLEMQRERRLMLGELLVQLSLVSPDDVDHLVRVKTEQTVFDLMLWEEGEFFFVDEAQPRRGLRELNLTVDHFVFEGARQVDERMRMRTLVPDVSHRVRLVQPINEDALDEGARAIVRAIDGERSVEEIALACRMAEFDVLSFIHEGVSAQAFEILPPSPTPRPIPGSGHATWRDLIREAETSLSLGDLLEAYRSLRSIRERHAINRSALDAARAVEKEIEKELEKAPLGPTVVLELAVPLQQLTELKSGPDEAFVISRINGKYTVSQILSVLPGTPLYNLLIVHNLIQRGVVKTRESQSMVKYRGFRFGAP